MNRYQETGQAPANFPAGQNDLSQGFTGPIRSQGDDMDTHERIANGQVATASGYPPCLLTALPSKTNDQVASQPSSVYPAPKGVSAPHDQQARELQGLQR